MNDKSKDLLLRGLYEQEVLKAQRERDVKLFEESLGLAHELRLKAAAETQEISQTLLQLGVEPGEVESARPTRPFYYDVARTTKLLDEAVLRIERPDVFRPSGGAGGGGGGVVTEPRDGVARGGAA